MEGAGVFEMDRTQGLTGRIPAEAGGCPPSNRDSAAEVRTYPDHQEKNGSERKCRGHRHAGHGHVGILDCGKRFHRHTRILTIRYIT